MAATGTTTTLRSRRAIPYVLALPGLAFLFVFFIVPLVTLLRTSLSSKPERFLPDTELTWEWGNFTTAFDDFGGQLLRAFAYAAIATILCLLIAYPIAYFIAFHGGRYRNILVGLVMVPFFTSFLLRTIAWQSLLNDSGPVLGIAERLHLVGLLDALGIVENGRLLETQAAALGGLTYNFLPFMMLPIYVSLEKIDPALIDASADLYASFARTFRRVILPLSAPGVFAGTLLTFIPATGDFINVELLGSTEAKRVIGNVVQEQFLGQNDYPTASAISVVLMLIITTLVLVYARFVGTEELA